MSESYGSCPICHTTDARGTTRERSPDGYTICGECGKRTKSAQWTNRTTTTAELEFTRCKHGPHGDTLDSKMLVAGSGDRPNLEAVRIGRMVNVGEWYAVLRNTRWT